MLYCIHMKFVSWNVNGLRAVTKKGFFPTYVASGEYDVIFLMETKSEIGQLSDEVISISGYSFMLQPSTYKKGYAGVGMYVRDGLSAVIETGFSHDCALHDEERIMTVSLVHPIHGRIAITGAYFPNGARGSVKRGGDVETNNRVSDESNPLPTSPFSSGRSLKTAADFGSNLEYKLAFFTEFQNHMEHLEKSHDHVLVCGDINIAHHPIDLARPESNKNSVGFLPVERARLDAWHSDGWRDIWRELHSDEVVYSWWDVISGARARNVGWRIDAWWMRQSSLPIIDEIRYDTEQMGSDHCPVVVILK